MTFKASTAFTVTIVVLLSLIVGKHASHSNFIAPEEQKVARNIIPSSKIRDMKGTHAGNIGTKNFIQNNIWPNARVPYRLNPNLDDRIRILIERAFQDFHSKTCVQFVPRQASDQDYLEILYDEIVECGITDFCRQGARQTARFRENCYDNLMMVQSLGRTICMSSEEQRMDRDDYVRFENCDPPPKLNPPEWTNPSFYDYFGMMHSYSGPPSLCIRSKMEFNENNGWFGNPGTISVLDADKINARYNCTGCFSYRWKSFNQITSNDYLEPAGSAGVDHTLYICRFYVKGEVVVGKASFLRRTCWVPFGSQEISSNGSQKFEVLTNPNRISFSWVQVSRGGTLPAGSIAGGRKCASGYVGGLPENYYIARCNIQGHLTPGAVHAKSVTVLAAYEGRAQECTSFEVLTCNN